MPITIAVSPASLNLSSIAGAPAFPAGSISVTGTGPSVPFNAATNGVSWLSLSAASGTTPGQIGAFRECRGTPARKLQWRRQYLSRPGREQPSDAPRQPGSPAPQNLTVSANSLDVRRAAGAQAPAAPDDRRLRFRPAVLPFTAAASTISPQGGTWLLVSPPTGTAGTPRPI